MYVSFYCELNLSASFEPTFFIEDDACDEQKEAMKNEYDSLIKNETWKLVDPLVGTKPIGFKWVYKNKYKLDGSLEKPRARLLVKGYAKNQGIEYEE